MTCIKGLSECPIEDHGLICMANYPKSRMRVVKQGERWIEPCSKILDVSKYKTRDMTLETVEYTIR